MGRLGSCCDLIGQIGVITQGIIGRRRLQCYCVASSVVLWLCIRVTARIIPCRDRG